MKNTSEPGRPTGKRAEGGWWEGLPGRRRAFLGRLRRKPQERGASISAVITRADGTVEDLGVISKGKVTFVPDGKAKHDGQG